MKPMSKAIDSHLLQKKMGKNLSSKYGQKLLGTTISQELIPLRQFQEQQYKKNKKKRQRQQMIWLEKKNSRRNFKGCFKSYPGKSKKRLLNQHRF